MSDNIYKVLMGDNAPFGGISNINYYDRTIRGVIVAIHYDLMKENVLQQNTYRTVDVKWLEGKPYTSTFVHIPELVSFYGYGLNMLPSVGDIVLASFDSNNDPHIVNIVSRCSVFEHGAINTDGTPILNSYGDPIVDNVIENTIRPTAIRYIKEGEISLTSKNSNSELYFNEKGTAKLITRVPDVSEENGVQQGDRLWEMSIGRDVIDESNGEIKKSAFDKNIQYQLYGHKNGMFINVDEDGNFEFFNNGVGIQIGKEGTIYIRTKKENKIVISDDTGIDITDKFSNNIKMDEKGIMAKDCNANTVLLDSDGIKLGPNATFSAVLGEQLKALITSMIGVYNSHVHIVGETPTSNPTTPMIDAPYLSSTVKLKM